MYTATFEMMYILVVTWLPCFVLPCHVLAIFFYVYPVAFLVAVVDHSGRDFTVTLPELPSLGLPRIVLYDSKRHDDHHRLRKGNYATIVFQIDTLFGTEINRKRPPTHAQQLWAHAAVKVRVVGRFGVLYLRLKDNLSELSARSRPSPTMRGRGRWGSLSARWRSCSRRCGTRSGSRSARRS